MRRFIRRLGSWRASRGLKVDLIVIVKAIGADVGQRILVLVELEEAGDDVIGGGRIICGIKRPCEQGVK